MSRHLVWFIGLGIVMIQNTLFYWVVPLSMFFLHYKSMPHLTLFYIIMIGLLVNRYVALTLGVCFGLLIDIMAYGNMIGIYAFGLALIGYLAGLLRVYLNDTFLTHLHVTLGGILAFEIMNYTSNRLFKIIDYPFLYAFIHFILPTMLLNLILVMLLYVPYKKLILKIMK